MVQVIEQKNIFQKTKGFFVDLGMKRTVGLAFVLVMGGGFAVTYSMLNQPQDIRQRAAEIETLTPTPTPSISPSPTPLPF